MATTENYLILFHAEILLQAEGVAIEYQPYINMLCHITLRFYACTLK